MKFKKEMCAVLLLLLVLPLVSAGEIEVVKKTIHPIVIKELSLPAVVNMEVTPNKAYSDYYYINTYTDMVFAPKEIGNINSGAFKAFDLKIYPSKEFKENNYGNIAFEYFIRGDNTPLKRDVLVISVLPMKDFAVIEMPSEITINDKKIKIKISFKDNLDVNSSVKISSKFFEKESLVKISKDVQEFELELNSEKKDAGVYSVNFDFFVNDEKASVVKEMILLSSVDVVPSEATEGNILMKKYTSTRTNNGNSPAKVTIEMSRTIWTSLFTSSEGNPEVRREGSVYVYSWEKEINPQESFTAVLKVNYYIPFIIFILLVIAFAVYRAVTTSQIQIKKTAVRVKTKSGLFASKIIIALKNKGGPVSNLKVIDHLPAFTELLPERFGILEPTEVKKRSLVWHFDKLDRGEELMFSYIVYSKVTIFGKLEVPPAIVTFVNKAGAIKESLSNKVFILAEEHKEKKF